MLRIMKLGVMAALVGLMSSGAVAAPTIKAGPGVFGYQYLSISGNSGSGVTYTPASGAVADPNAVVGGNAQFLNADGGATYCYGNSPASNASTNTLSYFFVAAPGQMFSGNITIKDRQTVYYAGSIVGAISLDGGAFTQFDNDPGANPNGPDDRHNTSTLNVNGATSLTIRYTLTNIAPDDTQLFRFSSKDSPAANTSTDGFFVNGSTVAAPEPAGLGLLVAGGVIVLRRRRR